MHLSMLAFVWEGAVRRCNWPDSVLHVLKSAASGLRLLLMEMRCWQQTSFYWETAVEQQQKKMSSLLYFSLSAVQMQKAVKVIAEKVNRWVPKKVWGSLLLPAPGLWFTLTTRKKGFWMKSIRKLSSRESTVALNHINKSFKAETYWSTALLVVFQLWLCHF